MLVITMSQQQIEADLARLETGLRELKIQYDMFFAGALPHEPFVLRARLERMVKQYSEMPLRKYQHRFQLNQLVARFNSFCELWGRHIRSLEEGDRVMPALRDRADARERVVARCRLGEQAQDRDLKRIHKEFMKARKQAEGDGKAVPFKAFAAKIAAQARQLREAHGCDAVELKVVKKDRQVLLKAKPAG